jgi:hypothetical protein
MRTALDVDQWRAIVEPLPLSSTRRLSEWIDAELEVLEATFRQFHTPRSVAASLGR